MSENVNCHQPYRATRLWNEVILAFQTGMPLKRHRHRIRTYDNCFTAADCVSWLNTYLKNNPNFGPHVTRRQSLQLLQKFLKCHVIESVPLKVGKSEFKDNNNLYRFVEHSSSTSCLNKSMCNPNRLPLTVLSGNVSIVSKEKNLPKLTKVTPWKFNSFDRESAENVHQVLKSCKTGDLPKCHLIEKRLSVHQVEEVWKTSAFNRLENLLSLSNLEEYFDNEETLGKNIIHNSNRLSKSGVVELIDKSEDIPHWVISAMKCLANWPDATGSSSCLPNYPGFEKDVFKVVKDFFINPQTSIIPANLYTLILKAFCKFGQIKIDLVAHLEVKFILNKKPLSSSPFPDGKQKTSTPKSPRTKAIPNNVNVENIEGRRILDDSTVMWEYPLSMCYETEFATVSPVTRVVPDYKVPGASSKQSLLSLSTIGSCNAMSVETSSTISACSNATNRAKLSKSLDNLKDCGDCDINKTLKCSSLRNLSNDLEMLNIENNFSSHKIGKCPPENIFSHTNCYSVHSAQNVYGSKLHNSKNQEQYGLPKTVNSPSVQSVFKVTSNTIANLKEAIQIILLLLPIPNRRHLHLLLRMMSKILNNNELHINTDNLQTKEYLIKTFAPAVVKCDDLPHGDYVVSQVLTFFMNECESLLIAPTSLKEEAFTKITEMQRCRVKYTLDDSCTFTYCEIISKQQYQEQKVSTSKQALLELLERIALDDKMTTKNKKKMLKQFKENHREIYYERFPCPRDEESLFSKHHKQILPWIFNSQT